MAPCCWLHNVITSGSDSEFCRVLTAILNIQVLFEGELQSVESLIVYRNISFGDILERWGGGDLGE